MYEIQWFKVDKNIFSNRKTQIILKLPEGDTYFRVWIQLIALAVECNNKGKIERQEYHAFYKRITRRRQTQRDLSL